MIEKQKMLNGRLLVRFSVPASLSADQVYLVGSFNGWNERATPMERSEEGWAVTLELPEGRAFEYRYLVDGSTWINDWGADSYVYNQYGGSNSVVQT